MVEDQGAWPKALDARTSGRDAAPRLTSDDDEPDSAGPQIELFFAGDFTEMLGIRGRAADHRNLVVHDGPQPRKAGHSAARKNETAQTRRRFERGPEPEKGAKGKGEKKPIRPM